MSKETKKESVITYSTLGNLVEALYDSLPKNVRNAHHRNLLVAMALLDIRARFKHESTKRLALA